MAAERNRNNMNVSQNANVNQATSELVAYLQGVESIVTIDFNRVDDALRQGARVSELEGLRFYRFPRQIRNQMTYDMQQDISLLMAAVISGHEGVITKLLEGDDRSLSLAKNSSNNNALHILLNYINDKIGPELGISLVRQMIKSEPSILTQENSVSERPLDIVIKKSIGSPVYTKIANIIIDSMVEEKMDVDQPDHMGITYLINAAKKGNLHVAERLLENGAKINAQSREGMTALMYAAKNDNRQMVTFLLKKIYTNHQNPQDIVNTQDRDGFTALMHAAKNSNYAIVDLLLAPEIQATKNIRNSKGRSAQNMAKTKKMKNKLKGGRKKTNRRCWKKRC